MAEKTSLTSEEVSELLMTSPATLCEWVEKGNLHILVDGEDHCFDLEYIQQIVRENGLSLNRPGQRRLRILIIDDDISTARFLARLFGILSDTVEVQVAHNAYQAGRRIIDFKPDVVLLDLFMPRHEGFDICRQIKSDHDTSHIRVIAVTDYASHEYRQRIVINGAEACLHKPINHQELFETIGLMMERPEAVQTIY